MPSGLCLQCCRELLDLAQRLCSAGSWADQADGVRHAAPPVLLGAALDEPGLGLERQKRPLSFAVLRSKLQLES